MNALSDERRVLTYGTFDLFHYGHVRLLKRLAAMGDRLIVGLSTDGFNAKKGKAAVMSYNERREVLLSCRYVDQVISETHWEQKRTDIINYNISLFVMGDDWAGKFDELNDVTQVLYVPRTPEISSTFVKDRMTLGSAPIAKSA